MINRITKLLLIVLPLIATGKAWGQCGSDQYYLFNDGEYNSTGQGPCVQSTSAYTSVYEFIITQEELAEKGLTGGIIKSISFESRVAISRTMTFYLAHIDKDNFCLSSGDSPEYVKSGLTRVVNAQSVSWGSSGWTEVSFSTNFEYNGSQNLLIVAIDNTNTRPSTAPSFVVWQGCPGYKVVRSDDTNSGAMTLGADNFTTTRNAYKWSYRPNMRFKVQVPTCASPTIQRSIVVTGNTAKISWEENGTATSWEVKYGAAGFNPGTAGTTLNASTNPFTITGLTANTAYEVCVRAVCGANCKSGYTEKLYFRTLPTGGDCSSGEGVSRDVHEEYSPCYDFNSNGEIPYRSSYRYNYSQTIYTNQDIAVGSGTIVGITYQQMTSGNVSFSPGTLKIYMGHTSKTDFSDGYFVTTGLIEVYSNTSTKTLSYGMNYIEFTTPFEYNGTDNLVVAFSDSRNSKVGYGSNYGHIYYASKSSYYKTLTKYSDVSGSPISPIPPTSTGTKREYYPRAIFHICSAEPFCSAPIITGIDDAVNSDVIVTWERGLEGIPNNYNIRYRIEGSGDWQTTSSNTTSASLASLRVSNIYEVQVQATCTNSLISDWSTRKTFTECGPYPLPFSEGFESYAAGYPLIPCWHFIKYDGTNYDVGVAEIETVGSINNSSAYVPAGSRGIYLNMGNFQNPKYKMFVTPEISVNSLADCNVSYKIKPYYNISSNALKIYVGVMTDPADPSTFHSVVENGDACNSGTVLSKSVSLSGYSGTGKYVAIKVVGNGYTNEFGLDDITVDYRDACHPPYGFVGVINCPNVNLSWTALAGFSNVKYSIYRDGAQIASNLTTTSYTDSNAPGGNHTYEIMATSSTASCTSTSRAPYTVYGINCCERLTAPSIGVTRGDRQVVVNWGTSANASSYTLYYGVNTPNPSIDNVWKVTGLTNQSSPYTVLRLTNEQTYKFAVMPVGTGRYCTDNPLSEIKEATPNCQ
ncbi:MAG: fibronectin type III domain-containing protein [Bacteroidales bacterium]|nr:fibronectin type III domain-containing protein [Bacteroidales bacterium]